MPECERNPVIKRTRKGTEILETESSKYSSLSYNDAKKETTQGNMVPKESKQ